MVVGNEIQDYQQGVSMELTTLEDPSNLRNHHNFGIHVGKLPCQKDFKAGGAVLWSASFLTLPG